VRDPILVCPHSDEAQLSVGDQAEGRQSNWSSNGGDAGGETADQVVECFASGSALVSGALPLPLPHSSEFGSWGGTRGLRCYEQIEGTITP